MKISDKEVQAALSKYYSFKGSTSHDNMRAALEAAYTVQKARKAAKKARKADEADRIDRSINLIEKNKRENPENTPPPSAETTKPEQPEPQFGIGEWMTRGGGKAVISSAASPGGWKLYGFAPNGAATCWPKNGVYDTSPCTVHDYDLVGPWTEPAKPEWKYEVGKSYRTRDGKMAEITGLSRSVSYPLLGRFGGAEASWASNGARLRGEENPSDLVGPWED